MAKRAPTRAQYQRLRALAYGSILLTGRRREYGPLLVRGWVREVWPETRRANDPGVGPVQITPDGLRALALAVERFGWPEMGTRPRRVAA